jgi:cyclomaltodextrinase
MVHFEKKRRSELKTPELPEFILGKLSTKEGRLKQARIGRMGFYHDAILEPADPRPGQAVTISARVGTEISLATATLYITTNGTAPTIPPNPDHPVHPDHPAVTALAMERTSMRWDTLQWSYLETWSAEIPGQPSGTHVQYVVEGLTRDGRTIYSPFIDMTAPAFVKNRADFDLQLLDKLDRENRPVVYGFTVDDEEIPGWFREAIIYQIFAERFAPDPGSEFAEPADRMGFYGGTLKGILSRLDYLQELGVNCLWLTPVFPSPSHHGYDPTGYGDIEPRLGTMEEFRQLVAEVHRRGMRLVLDFVANHCSNRHSIFKAAQEDRESESYPWFRFFDWPEFYDSYYGLPNLPRFVSDHPGVRAYLAGHARRWLERGVDGFRLDHAHGSSHAFWSVFRAETRAAKADSITFGEITETPAFIRSYQGRMDGCLDFKLLETLRSFFAYGSLTAGEFDKALAQHFAYFGEGLLLPSFLDNHDMNRFLWIAGGDKRKLRLAALCQFTLPGPPIIYYGTEVGLSQLKNVGPLEESRLPMIWGEEQDGRLFEFYKALIALRRRTAATWRRPRQTLLIDDDQGLYGYACGEYGVFLNNGPAEVSLSLGEWAPLEPLLASDPAFSLTASGDRLTLPAYAGIIVQGDKWD